MRKLLIHSPLSHQSSQGNTVTVARLEKILAEQGHEIMLEAGSHDSKLAEKTDLFIALNARKSADPIIGFKKTHPETPVIIILTGTDINHPSITDQNSKTWEALTAADRLVALHEGSLSHLPTAFHNKCEIIYPSLNLPKELKHSPSSTNFHLIMAGNFRPEKDIPTALEAAQKISLPIHAYGDASPFSATPPANFHIHGVISHNDLLEKMTQAHLLLNTSSEEGGANAVCEAICLGLPVIASDISGNTGMLGSEYGGYFPQGDAASLAEKITSLSQNPARYAELKSQIGARAPLFHHSLEATQWHTLVKKLAPY